MPEPIANILKKSIVSAKWLYHQLVLIVGNHGSGKTAVIQALSKEYGTDPINLNLSLSKELLSLTEKQRKLKLSEFLTQIVSQKGDIIFLDNIELLFDANLKHDPLRLLQGLSRNIVVVASWYGNYCNGKLIYAEPGHSEYRCYDISDTLIVSMMEEKIWDN